MHAYLCVYAYKISNFVAMFPVPYVCILMRVCMYTYVCVHVSVCVYVCIRPGNNVYVRIRPGNTYVCIRMHVCMYPFVCKYVYALAILVYAYVCVCVCIQNQQLCCHAPRALAIRIYVSSELHPKLNPKLNTAKLRPSTTAKKDALNSVQEDGLYTYPLN